MTVSSVPPVTGGRTPRRRGPRDHPGLARPPRRRAAFSASPDTAAPGRREETALEGSAENRDPNRARCLDPLAPRRKIRRGGSQML